jgi:2-polyprenyl-3-methyl-5-hydroxy-6-metoxy-1,4-benzoquinol methylase
MSSDKFKFTQKDPFAKEIKKSEQDYVCEQINKYEWLQSIEVVNGISTKGKYKNREFILKQFDFLSFKDKTVLDIGCADCLYSFEAEKRGAKQVVSLDKRKSKAASEFLIPFFNSKISLIESDFLKYKPSCKFDVIIFAGLLYGVEQPFFVFDLLNSWLKEDGFLIIETAVYTENNEKPLLWLPSLEENPHKIEKQNKFFNHKAIIETLKQRKLELVNIYPDNRGKEKRQIDRESFLFKKNI